MMLGAIVAPTVRMSGQFLVINRYLILPSMNRGCQRIRHQDVIFD